MSVVFIYIGIGYIIPTIGGNVSVGGFLCALECTFCNIFIFIGYMLPTFGEYMSVEYICWYWIYNVNNWGMNVDFLNYIFVLDICCQHLENICL